MSKIQDKQQARSNLLQLPDRFLELAFRLRTRLQQCSLLLCNKFQLSHTSARFCCIQLQSLNCLRLTHSKRFIRHRRRRRRRQEILSFGKAPAHHEAATVARTLQLTPARALHIVIALLQQPLRSRFV